MINQIKDEINSILEDLEKINEGSSLDQLILKFQKTYKQMIILQHKIEDENAILGLDQKDVNTGMETINEIVTEIPDETNNDRVDDLFSSVAHPEFIMKDNNTAEISHESKKHL